MPKISRDRVLYSTAAPLKPGETPPEAPPIEFSEPTPTTAECDYILGVYLRNWNQVETQVGDLFCKLLGAHQSAARIIIASGMTNQTLRDIIIALGGQRLSPDDCDKLETLMERIKRATTKRNRIVHGHWRIAIQIVKGGPNTATWERVSDPTDPRLFAQMHGKNIKQKVREAHIFSPNRIAQLAKEANELSNHIKQFSDSLSVLPFPNAAPISVSQSS